MTENGSASQLETVKTALRWWDSVGVIDKPIVDDDPGLGEYDSYAPTVLRFLRAGKNADVAADDNVFTDDGVNLYAPPPGGVVDFYVRAGVATDDGTAAFADFHCTFGEIYGLILADDFESGGISAWSGFAP